MPTDARILGFGNEWYEAASQNASLNTPADGKEILMVSVFYFLTAKPEALTAVGMSVDCILIWVYYPNF